MHQKLVSVVRDGGVDDIGAYIDETRNISETNEALNILTPARRLVARESLEAGRPYEFPRCAGCGSPFHPDASYRWCPGHVADADVVIDNWNAYWPLPYTRLEKLPKSLRVAPGGGFTAIANESPRPPRPTIATEARLSMIRVA